MPSLTLKTRIVKFPRIPGAGPLIKDALAKSGLSVKDLARKTGLPKRRIEQLSRDARCATVRDIQLLAPALGISSLHLFLAQQMRNQCSMAVTQMNQQLNHQLGGLFSSAKT
jgi:plasmid maintenance system antidote protein VapI